MTTTGKLRGLSGWIKPSRNPVASSMAGHTMICLGGCAMFKIDQESLINAVCTWGKEAQIRQTKEECAELIVALSHYQRSPTIETTTQVAEEIADVLIMMHQLAIIFSSSAVYQQVDVKMKRLKERIDNAIPGHNASTRG
jgi:NTP pyrophosphatase (non-canonical NTP hydrolase)